MRERDLPVTYAGFFSRWGGSIIDSIVLTLANFAANLVMRVLASALVSATQSVGIVILVLILQLIVNVTIWWALIPSRMARNGATIGMSAVGIKIVGATDHFQIGAGLAFVRGLLAAISQMIFAIPFVLYLVARIGNFSVRSAADFRDVVIPDLRTASILGFLLLLPILPAAWNVVDRRRQTLYDKMTNVIVITA